MASPYDRPCPTCRSAAGLHCLGVPPGVFHTARREPEPPTLHDRVAHLEQCLVEVTALLVKVTAAISELKTDHVSNTDTLLTVAKAVRLMQQEARE